jgi:hypothetical protein
MIFASEFYKWCKVFNVQMGPGGQGDVVGPASATVGDIAFYASTTGKLIGDTPNLNFNTGTQTLKIGAVSGTGTLITSVIRPDVNLNNTLEFRATDIDGASDVILMSIRSSNTPRLLIGSPAGGTVIFTSFGGTFTIDSATIGGTTAAAGTFTTLVANTSITANGDITLANGVSIKTGTAVANTFNLQVYDTNDLTYRSAISLSANNTPTLQIGNSGLTTNIDAANLGGNAPVTISQATSVTTNALTVNDSALLQCPVTADSITITADSLTQKYFTSNSGSSPSVLLANGYYQEWFLNDPAPQFTLPTALASGKTQQVFLVLTQTTGGAIPTWVNTTFASGVAPTIALGAGESTYLTAICSPTGSVLFANAQANPTLIVGNTDVWGGGGTTHTFSAPGLTTSSQGAASIITSTNAVGMTVAPGTDVLIATFSSDPGAGTQLSFIYSVP